MCHTAIGNIASLDQPLLQDLQNQPQRKPLLGIRFRETEEVMPLLGYLLLQNRPLQSHPRHFMSNKFKLRNSPSGKFKAAVAREFNLKNEKTDPAGRTNFAA